ncbi:hypothetical protein TIFTF001_023767 [Ficus carica]|uniref:Uncharacterized protein n=1 Tax=Ficus carica TaxID=3494 RepID=A0AA88AFD7_FICCA|nr:hypothetical protein TIFTF001_023767 [Ficus carica]
MFPSSHPSKFALAFKAKTFEFFADKEATAAIARGQFLSPQLAEEVIIHQKVVIIKPDFV